MSREEIIAQVAEKLNIKESEIDLSKRFKEDLELDSIDLVELLMDVEEKLSIEVPDEKAVKIKTIEDLVKVILEEV